MFCNGGATSVESTDASASTKYKLLTSGAITRGEYEKQLEGLQGGFNHAVIANTVVCCELCTPTKGGTLCCTNIGTFPTISRYITLSQTYQYM